MGRKVERAVGYGKGRRKCEWEKEEGGREEEGRVAKVSKNRNERLEGIRRKRMGLSRRWIEIRVLTMTQFFPISTQFPMEAASTMEFAPM